MRTEDVIVDALRSDPVRIYGGKRLKSGAIALPVSDSQRSLLNRVRQLERKLGSIETRLKKLEELLNVSADHSG